METSNNKTFLFEARDNMGNNTSQCSRSSGHTPSGQAKLTTITHKWKKFGSRDIVVKPSVIREARKEIDRRFDDQKSQSVKRLDYL